MKKTLLTLVIMAFAAVSFAQTTKPAEGDLLTEVNFNLATLSNNFELPNLRFRYFIAEDLVVRADLGVQGGKTTSDVYENQDGTGATGTEESKTSGIYIAVGAEKHWSGTNRLSPYMGAQLGFRTGSNSFTNTNADGSGNYVMDYSQTMEGKTSGFGIGLLLGADYWIGNSFYFGTELGFNFGASTTGDMTTETSFGGTTTKRVSAGGKSTGFGESITPAIRLGFALK